MAEDEPGTLETAPLFLKATTLVMLEKLEVGHNLMFFIRQDMLPGEILWVFQKKTEDVKLAFEIFGPFNGRFNGQPLMGNQGSLEVVEVELSDLKMPSGFEDMYCMSILYISVLCINVSYTVNICLCMWMCMCMWIWMCISKCIRICIHSHTCMHVHITRHG